MKPIGKMSGKRRRAIRASLPQVCVKCGSTESLTLDHVVARALGGSNARYNLQLLCHACNQAKATLEAGEYAERKKAERKLQKQATAAYFRRQAMLARIEGERLSKLAKTKKRA